MCGQGAMTSWVPHPMPSSGAGGGTGRGQAGTLSTLSGSKTMRSGKFKKLIDLVNQHMAT